MRFLYYLSIYLWTIARCLLETKRAIIKKSRQFTSCCEKEKMHLFKYRPIWVVVGRHQHYSQTQNPNATSFSVWPYSLLGFVPNTNACWCCNEKLPRDSKMPWLSLKLKKFAQLFALYIWWKTFYALSAGTIKVTVCLYYSCWLCYFVGPLLLYALLPWTK